MKTSCVAISHSAILELHLRLIIIIIMSLFLWYSASGVFAADSPKPLNLLVITVDVMPSVLELLDVKPPAGMDGRSWVPLLKGEPQTDRDFVITHVNAVSSGKSFAQRCVRTKDRALMFHNLINDPKCSSDVVELSKKLLAHMNKTDDPQTKAFEAAIGRNSSSRRVLE